MILIADSGSTKTDWCVTKNGQLVRQVFTKGMNPFFQTREEMYSELRNVLVPHLDETNFESIYFYGAGCLPEKETMMQNVLIDLFNVSGEIEINTDMLGAARGVCGNQPGIVCVLGTGSNSCFYDGKTITANVPPLGFILGDEGSGAALGKLLAGDILKNQTGRELKEKFLNRFQLTQADILEQVYRKPFPNRFLASFSPFIAENIHRPEMHALVYNSFTAFLKRNVMQYDFANQQAHFIGSIAYNYREILVEAAKELNIEIGTIIQSPMKGLIEYHAESK